MLSSESISVRPTEICSKIRSNPSRLGVNFSSRKIGAISAGGNEAKNRISGDFSGLSALKEQLEAQAERSSGTGRLIALKEKMKKPETRISPAPLLLERKKQNAANDESLVEKEGGYVSLMVSNLPKELTRAEYESFMKQIPEICGCTYLNHKSGRCRGYGFCDVRPADVASVMEFLSTQTLGGRVLTLSFATGKKEVDAKQQEEEVGNKSTADKRKPVVASAEKKARASSSGNGSKRKPTLKSTLELKNDVKAVPDAQQHQRKVRSSGGDGPARNSKDASKREAGLETLGVQKETSSVGDGRLSGESVLAALERFATTGRARQRRNRATLARSTTSSEPEDDTENSDEPQLIEFKLDWAERIQSLEASIQQLKRS